MVTKGHEQEQSDRNNVTIIIMIKQNHARRFFRVAEQKPKWIQCGAAKILICFIIWLSIGLWWTCLQLYSMSCLGLSLPTYNWLAGFTCAFWKRPSHEVNPMAPYSSVLACIEISVGFSSLSSQIVECASFLLSANFPFCSHMQSMHFNVLVIGTWSSWHWLVLTILAANFQCCHLPSGTLTKLLTIPMFKRKINAPHGPWLPVRTQLNSKRLVEILWMFPFKIPFKPPFPPFSENSMSIPFKTPCKSPCLQ